MYRAQAKEGLSGNEEKNKQERANGRRVGLRGKEGAYGGKDGGGGCECV